MRALRKSAHALSREILAFMRRYPGPDAPEKEFEALALALFRSQYASNAVYRRFCRASHTDPAGVTSWKDIPAMPSRFFKEFSVASFAVKRAKKVFETSGTSIRTRGKHYFRTLDYYKAAIPAPFRFWLLPDKARLAYYFLIPSAADAPRSSLSYMMSEICRHFARGTARFYVKRGSPDYPRLAADLSKEKKPVMLLSTAFALSAFLDHLEKARLVLRLPAKSRIMETGGFKGKTREIPRKAFYDRCEKLLGTPSTAIVSEYGMTELTSQYYDAVLRDRKHPRVKRGPAWLRAVAVDPFTGLECRKGKTGVLKHVDLANVDSVLAVQTEDLGRARGSGFELLGRAPGSTPRGCSLVYEKWMAAAHA